MRAPGVVAAGVLLLSVTACGGSDPHQGVLGPDAATTPTASASPAASRETAPPETPKALLDQRARAVLDHDQEAFLAPVERSDPTFFATQRRLYLNLQRLPIGALSFSAAADGRVTRRLTLGRPGASFDQEPVVGPAGFAVSGTPGRLLVVPAKDDPATDPWDLTTIQVASGDGALVVTDGTDPRRARALLLSVQEGLVDVARAVPLRWSRTAVVYAFRGPAVLASYAKVPGGNLEHLGALTYPVRNPDDQSLVGTRVALLPTALDAGRQQLARIIRHELTHVAVGDLVDEVPTWLSEGLAQYVAALPTPAAERRIATVAVDRAETGGIVLPDGASFNDDQQALHYAVSWMACDYLAASRGSRAIWRLVEAMGRAPVGRDGVGQDVVLRAEVGLTGQQLADKAAARILRLFGPTPAPVPTPVPPVPTAAPTPLPAT